MRQMPQHREFEARADTIGAIRSFVEDALLRHGCPDEAIDAAVLCTSELATNALLHGDGDIGVDIDLTDRARVAVWDRNHRMPVLQRPDLSDDGGRGLLLVSMFADAWGFEPADDGKHVWFEIDVQRPRSQAGGNRGRRRSDAGVSAD